MNIQIGRSALHIALYGDSKEGRTKNCEGIHEDLAILFKVLKILVNIVQVRDLADEIRVSFFDFRFQVIKVAATCTAACRKHSWECRLHEILEICALHNLTLVLVDLLRDVLQHEVHLVTSLHLVVERA